MYSADRTVLSTAGKGMFIEKIFDLIIEIFRFTTSKSVFEWEEIDIHRIIIYIEERFYGTAQLELVFYLTDNGKVSSSLDCIDLQWVKTVTLSL